MKNCEKRSILIDFFFSGRMRADFFFRGDGALIFFSAGARRGCGVAAARPRRGCAAAAPRPRFVFHKLFLHGGVVFET